MLIASIAAAMWSHQVRYGRQSVPEIALMRDSAAVGSDLEQKVLSFVIDGRSPKGAKQWHLEGNSAEIIGDDIYLNDLKAVAYGDDSKIDLTSDKGIYRKEKGEVELIGNVEVVSDDGAVLITESAKWSQLTKEISTADKVRVEREGMVAIGIGAVANSEEKWAVLKQNVEVVIEPNTIVTCDGSMEVRYDDNTAVFLENVKVTDKDGQMFADKLVVYFDRETQKLARVEAEGNVKVKRGDSYTISEKAIYTESTKSAKLIGKPRVIIAPEQLQEFQGTDIAGQ